MSKRKQPRIRTKMHTSSTGIKITLRGLPPLVIPRLNETIVFPDKPTYEVPTEDGHVEVYEHDLESLNTDEDRAAWDKYLEDLEGAEVELTSKVIKVVLLEGIKVQPKGVEFEKWKKRQALMGMPVSDDEEEMLLHYKETRIIGTAEDIREITLIVMELTGVPKEEIDKLVASFSDSVESES